jgi:hypothetical protein
MHEVGKLYIIRTNEDGPLLKGKCIGFESLGNSTLPFMKVGRRELVISGATAEYTKELWDELEALPSWQAQWNRLAEN